MRRIVDLNRAGTGFVALGSFHCRQLEEMALDYILARKQADILRREKGYALQEECRGNVLVPKIKRGGRE